MSDPLKDPRYPFRPQHQDFWRIAEVALWMDGRASETNRDANEVLVEVVNEVCDFESLSYAAEQRALRILRIPGDMDKIDILAKVMTAFFDGFIIGAKFKERG